MIYEVSLYDIRPRSACLIHHSYWKRDTPYTGKRIIVQDNSKGKIIKYIDLIQQ